MYETIHSFLYRKRGAPVVALAVGLSSSRLRYFAANYVEREREREIFEGLITNNAFSSGGGLIHCSDDDVVANQRYYELLPDSFRCRPILARSGAMSCATGLLIPGY